MANKSLIGSGGINVHGTAHTTQVGPYGGGTPYLQAATVSSKFTTINRSINTPEGPSAVIGKIVTDKTNPTWGTPRR